MEQIDAQVSDLRYLSQAPIGLSSHDANTSSTSAPAYGSRGHSAVTPPILSPGSASLGHNSARPAASAQGSTAATPMADAGTKRKSIDEGSSSAKQTRSKRNRVSDCYFFRSANTVNSASHAPMSSFL